MQKIYKLQLLLISLLASSFIYAQCDPLVPLYQVNLSNNSDTTWILLEADALDRDGLCCSAASNENCIQFEITLHPNAAGIFFDYDGAGAFGSLAWQMDCGPSYNLKDTICVSDPGPFTITFCKPGTDGGNYFIRSVAKPTFPADQGVPLGCNRPLEVLGVTAASIKWNSVYPGNPGDYNYLLSCTDCLNPVLTPEPALQPYVEFAVEGYPLLDYCTGAFTFYDTVRFTFQDSIKLSIDNENATFCSGGSATINASATGGDNNYTFHWYNSSLVELFQGATFTTDIEGSYTVEVRDGNYSAGNCEGISQTFTVSESLPPIVDAGVDQVLCATSPNISLSGNVTYATGGVWTGGSGVYSPSNTELSTMYTPTISEISNGSISFTLTSSGAGGGCSNNFDEITVYFADTVKTDLSNVSLNCNYSETTLSPNVSGGITPYNYSWSNGNINQANTVGIGTFCLTVTDAIGCSTTDCATITAPTQLTVSATSNNATGDGLSDGDATATPSGGTSPYSYNWSSGGTNATESNLGYGIYTVTVTDNNGCSTDGSVVVNEPRCLGFSATTVNINVLCNGDSTGNATVSTTGGTSPFSYVWNDYQSQTTITAINLPANVYTVIVSDADGCETFATATVSENTALNSVMTHVDATTLGGNDGSANASISGGQSPYSLLWNNGESTSLISNLTSDVYVVEITDNLGCTHSDSVFVSEPPCNDFIAFVSPDNVTCFGDADGTSNLTLLNGVAPFSINWSSGQTDTTFIDNLSTGLYTVEITDSRNCYTFTSFSINEPSPLSIGLSVTSVSCNGANDGTIDLTVAGGTYPSYSYSWSNGKTTQDIINLGVNSYTITVSDANNCSTSASTTISEPSALTYSYTTTNITCYGGSDGSIDMTINGGSLPYVYSWSTGAITQDLSGIDVGGYLLNLNDGNYCSPSSSIEVTITEADPVVIDTAFISCPSQGGSTAVVNVTVSGGNAGYQISYDNGSTFGILNDYSEALTVSNTYDIAAMDINGCTTLVSYPIEIDTNVYMQDFTVNYCYGTGQTTETVFITPNGGNVGDYQISFNNGISYNVLGDYSIDVAINSSYNILIKDENNCISETYPISLPAILTASTNVTSDYFGEDISCNGASDAEATTTATGGSSPYTYLWSNGQTNAIASGLSAATYSVTVSDTNGCSTSENVTISEPLILTSSATITSNYNGENISCNGESDGAALVSANGGVLPYNYLWDSGQTSDAISGMPAGTYQVITTDKNGCISTSTITFIEPPVLTSSTLVTSNYNGEEISCFGLADGEATTSASGGVSAYTYFWSDGQTSSTGSNLSSGTYSVTTTDANGCTSISTVTLTEPQELIASASITSDYNGQDISCTGEADGQASSSAVGGTDSYSYSWTNGQNIAVASGLSSGTYTVTITDINGCSDDASVTLVDPINLSSTIAVTSDYNGLDISCFGFSDGQAIATPSGGTSPYTFDWTNGQTTQTASGLNAGTHIATITDVNGCNFSIGVVLTQPLQLTSTISILSSFNGEDISCFEGSNGKAKVTPTGGTLPYSYLWSDGQTLNTANGLSAGLYTVTVTDINSCITTNSISLTQPTEIAIDVLITDVSCNGGNDGVIDITPSGGISPFTFQWSNGALSEDAINLTADSYTVIIIDDNGCKDTLDNLVVDPTAIDLDIAITNALCKNDMNGAIDLSTTGGTPPYSYNWSSSDTTQDISNKPAGTYSVVVTDGNGCFTNISGDISEPDSLLFDFSVSDVICYGEENGYITITTYGGTEPYTFNWSNGDTTESISNLAADLYYLAIIDNNNCFISNSIIVTQPDSLWSTASSPEYFHGYNISLYGLSDGSIELEVLGGTQPYTYDWSNNETSQDIKDITAGEYSVLISDDNGCEYYTVITLTEPFDLAMPTGFSPNSDGRNDFYEIKGIDAYPDNELTIFNRWGNIVFNATGYNNTWNGISNAGSDLPDGTYFVIIVINKGQDDEIELNNYFDLRR